MSVKLRAAETLLSLRGFKVVHVFDVAQTDGEPIEDLDAVRPKLLDGSASEGIWDALVKRAGLIGYEVIRHRRGSENGHCDFLNKDIGRPLSNLGSPSRSNVSRG